jgi:hypothetical protein
MVILERRKTNEVSETNDCPNFCPKSAEKISGTKGWFFDDIHKTDLWLH